MVKSYVRLICDPWLAAVLLTRLPLPRLADAAFQHSARAAWAYPLVGVLVGIIGTGVLHATHAIGLDAWGASGLALAAMMLATGAMHEDGLADCADGFWGGTNKARRLEIMRDSQIGTYGVLALIIVTLFRWYAISTTLMQGDWIAVIVAACLSRAMMPLAMTSLPHARDDGLSRSVGAIDAKTAMLSVLIGVVITIICFGATGVVAVIAALVVTACVAGVARRKIGGQTGDVLGAVQQLTEVAILLIFLVV